MGVVIVTRSGQSIGTHPVGSAPLTVGGKQDCDVCVKASGIGDRQLFIVEKGGMAALKNVGARDVAFLNGAAIEDVARVRNGDTIQIGDIQLQYFESAPATEQEAAKPVAVAVAEGEPSDAVHVMDTAFFGGEMEDEDAATTAILETGEADVLVGEFIEAEASEDESLQSGGASECERLPLPPALRKLVHARLNVFRSLDTMDAERRSLLEDPEIPEQAENELRRQIREAQNIPRAQAAQAHIEKLEKKLAAMEERVERGEAQPYPPLLQAAVNMALRQWQLCIERETLLPEIMKEALPLAREEPLHAVLKAGGVKPDLVFAWALYALALTTLSAEYVEENNQIKQELAELDDQHQGFFSKLRGLSDEDRESREKLLERNKVCTETLMRIARELAAIEKSMVDEFWRVYGEAAHLLINGRVQAGEQLVLRAFVRYGLLGVKPWFVPAGKVRYLLDSCSDVVREWDFSMAATHVLYPDEYMGLVADGKITPSIDENLELNQRNSPEWRADKAWRRIVHTYIEEAALKETAAVLEARILEIRERQEELELQRDKLIRTAPDYKERHRSFSQQIQRCRVEAGRFQRSVDRIHQKYLPGLEEIRVDAQAKLDETNCTMTREYLVRREATGIHRVSRLCANLRERFPPFTLRDHYRPDSEAVNTRVSMLEEIKELERRDPTVFKEPLVAVKKHAHRIYLRFCPVVLLTPSCGFISYAWNPRHGPETGRLAVPGYMPRAGIRERMLRNAYADFRWDTSKASSGVDLLTSETLVAEYSRVRWEYRRRNKETREKAGIYNEENDRKNWRRHYALYLTSALDAGKLLFFKCYEIYEQVVLKYLDLPEGVDRLRR